MVCIAVNRSKCNGFHRIDTAQVAVAEQLIGGEQESFLLYQIMVEKSEGRVPTSAGQARRAGRQEGVTSYLCELNRYHSRGLRRRWIEDFQQMVNIFPTVG